MAPQQGSAYLLLFLIKLRKAVGIEDQNLKQKISIMNKEGQAQKPQNVDYVKKKLLYLPVHKNWGHIRTLPTRSHTASKLFHKLLLFKSRSCANVTQKNLLFSFIFPLQKNSLISSLSLLLDVMYNILQNIVLFRNLSGINIWE